MFRAIEKWEEAIVGGYSPIDTLAVIAKKFEGMSTEDKAMYLVALEMSKTGGTVKCLDEKIETISTTHNFKKAVYVFNEPAERRPSDIHSVQMPVMEWLKDNRLIGEAYAETQGNNVTSDGIVAIHCLTKDLLGKKDAEMALKY